MDGAEAPPAPEGSYTPERKPPLVSTWAPDRAARVQPMIFKRSGDVWKLPPKKRLFFTAEITAEDAAAIVEACRSAEESIRKEMACLVCHGMGEPDPDDPNYFTVGSSLRVQLLKCYNGHLTCMNCYKGSVLARLINISFASFRTNNSKLSGEREHCSFQRLSGPPKSCPMCRVPMGELRNLEAEGARDALRHMQRLIRNLCKKVPPLPRGPVESLASVVLRKLENSTTCNFCLKMGQLSMYQCSEQSRHLFCRGCFQSQIRSGKCAISNKTHVMFEEKRVGTPEVVASATSELRKILGRHLRLSPKGNDLEKRPTSSPRSPCRTKAMARRTAPWFTFVTRIGEKQSPLWNLSRFAYAPRHNKFAPRSTADSLRDMWDHFVRKGFFGISLEGTNAIFTAAYARAMGALEAHPIDLLGASMFSLPPCKALDEDRKKIAQCAHAIDAWLAIGKANIVRLEEEELETDEDEPPEEGYF